MVTANFEHPLIIGVGSKDESTGGTIDEHARNRIAIHVERGSLDDHLAHVCHAEETISRTDGDAAVRVIHGKRGGGTQAARIEKKLVGDQAARIRPEGLLARDFHDAFIDDGLPGVAVLHAEGQSHIGATGGRGQAQGHDVAVDRFDQGAVLDAAAGHRAADIDTSDIVHGNHRVIGGVGARARVQRIHGQRAATGFHEVEGRGTVIGDHRIQIEVVARHGELEVQFTSRPGTRTEHAVAIDGVGGAGGQEAAAGQSEGGIVTNRKCHRSTLNVQRVQRRRGVAPDCLSRRHLHIQRVVVPAGRTHGAVAQFRQFLDDVASTHARPFIELRVTTAGGAHRPPADNAVGVREAGGDDDVRP